MLKFQFAVLVNLNNTQKTALGKISHDYAENRHDSFFPDDEFRMRDLNPRPSKQRCTNVPFQQLHRFFSERLANSFSEEIQFEHASTFFSDHEEIIFRSIFHDPIPHIFNPSFPRYNS